MIAKAVYPSVPPLPLKMGGWCGPDVERWLQRAIDMASPRVVVEIGVWQGLSTTYLAKHTDPECVVYAVDHFLGSEEHTAGTPFAEHVPTLYDQFVSNMMHLGIASKVMPVPFASSVAARVYADVIPDVLYIDGSHEEPDVWADITEWGGRVKKSGVIVGDDYNWVGVHAAVERMKRDFPVHVHTDGRTWMCRGWAN